MAKSDGAVYIDTLMDTKGFSKGMNSVENRLKGFKGAIGKLGGAIAAAFAVKELVKFGKEAINLGSDLQEVQNVVDVTFTTMSEQVDEFARSAAESAGLSETMAKRYVGTFGAMAKAFGFAESESFNMSTALTQLAGDVSSFYNITQDEAYTKLKSVFTGETESLKDLGVVMTQSALDSYAMAKGLGKTTSQMTEQEKVALSYSYVMNQLSSAQGDFARTSDSWANQTKILSLNFDSFKANIGQALIAIFTPFLQVLNQIVSKMSELSAKFLSFIQLITGRGSSGGGSPGEALGEIAGGYDDVTDATNKAAKAQKNYTSGLDELNIMTPSESGSNAGKGAGISSLMPEENLTENKVLKDTEKSLNNIGNILEVVQKKLSGFIESFNTIIESIASVGVSIGTNLIKGLSVYLESGKGRIKQYLISMFDITEEIFSLVGQFADAFAYVFKSITNDSGIKITSDIISIFSEIFMTITEIAGRIFLDLTKLIAKPFIDSKEEIKRAFEDFLSGFSYVTNFIKEIVYDLSNLLKNFYDGVIGPGFDYLTQKVTEIIQGYIVPLVSQIGDALTLISEQLMLLWETVFIPIIEWVTENIFPVVLSIIKTIVDTIGNAVKNIINHISNLIKELTNNVFPGLVKFIIGVFKLDWKKAWEGVRDVFKGIINSMASYIEFFVNNAINRINGLISGINNLTGTIGIPAIPLIPEVKIPKLATGAVIPPNAPFMAMLGDQRHGNNIEAPEDLIRKIVREEAGLNSEVIVLLSEIVRNTRETADKEFVTNIDGRDLVSAYDSRKARNGYVF